MVFPNLGAKDGFSESVARILQQLFRGAPRQGELLASLYLPILQNATPSTA